MRTALDTLLGELCQDGHLRTPSLLYSLSDLEAGEAAQVQAAWPHLPAGLRQDLVARLVEIAEADIQVNFGAIFRLALDDQSPGVRAAAVEGLWEDNDVRLVPRLAARLRQDDDPAVRAIAAVSLGRFVLLGELEEIRPDPYAQAYGALLATCQDQEEHQEVRRRALESLAYADEEVVADLIREAYGAAEEKLRVSAVFAMGRSADRRWAQAVRQELFSPNPELRYEAARACGELQVSDSVADLEQLVDDVDPEVQEAALWSLGQIGGDRARQVLERTCASGNEALQDAAQAALDELEFMHGDLADLFNRLAEEGDW